MTTTVIPPLVDDPVRGTPRHRRTGDRPRVLLASALVFVLLAGLAALVVHRRWDDRHRDYLGADGWPVHGQAAYAIGGRVVAGPGQQPVPIASLAKVMTAWLVLRVRPLRGEDEGPVMTVGSRDVADTARRRAEQQSVVPVRRGERLTERQALTAVLLPSANNVSVMLARFTAGSVPAFVARMNRAARALGMRDTHYTDPSGYLATTVSTAQDQTLLARAVADNGTLTRIVAMSSSRLPVAGTVHNTDFLLGSAGFVGTKTGSDDAARGCFMFTTYRVVDQRVVAMVGAVLGQQGHSYVAAGQYAAAQLADRVAPVVPG